MVKNDMSICKYFVWVSGEHTNSENISNGKTLQYIDI